MKAKLSAILAAMLLVGACGKSGQEGGKKKAAEKKAEAEKKAKAGEDEKKKKEKKAEDEGIQAPSKGASKDQAKVHIVEFSDFQCPFCGKIISTLEKVEKNFGDQVRLTFMHNPLPFHDQAKPAAKAAVAAQKQGKFWEMHDKLFDNQKSLKKGDLEGYAKKLGLDVEQFKKHMKSDELGSFVDNNRAIAQDLGASGTPSFFINGKLIKGAQPYKKFKSAIEAEIEKAEASGESGWSWVKSRTKDRNEDLAKYLWEGKEPPSDADKKKKKKAEKKKQKKQKPIPETVYKATVNPEHDPMRGNTEDPLVTLVEFSDFQCPFCKRLNPTMEKLLKNHGDKIRVVWKDNPLPFHDQAMPASHAAMCAFDQGKFWEMHDKLFDNQKSLKPESLKSYAKDLGLDMDKWQKCFDDKKHKAHIEADQELASKVTARGTPNTFVNGRKVTGAKPYSQLEELVKEEAKKAKKLVEKKGISKDEAYAAVIEDGKVFKPLKDEQHDFDLSDSPCKGSKDAKVTVVEFSDFQCPFCSRVGDPLNKVKEHYGDKAAVCYKHFPLNFHENAMPAAIASECARNQGKFWEMHDKLFANQKSLSKKNFKKWAGEIGINKKKFTKCFDNKEPKDRIKADMKEARKAGVRGTPSIYINGRQFKSPSGYNLRAFTNVVDKHVLN